MSQVTKEAATTPEGRYNAYSYRYEPYGFDFKYITGDEDECCRNSKHKLLIQPDPPAFTVQYPFFASGLTGREGVEFLPIAETGDPVPARIVGVIGTA
jgi:hypothetical protein